MRLTTIAFAAALLPGLAAAADAPGHKDWAGKWIGVEGLALQITPAEEGRYALTLFSGMSDREDAEGRDVADGIAFERDGRTLTIRAASGAQTGLKWLAGMADCLMVAEGEGWCRDDVPVSAPQPGVLCDRVAGFCVDDRGVSLGFTEEYLGHSEAGRAYLARASGSADWDPARFTFSNGVRCDADEKACEIAVPEAPAAAAKELWGK